MGGVFYDGDGRKVHCAVNLDDKAGNMGSIDGALDRAAERLEVIELYAHRPGTTIDVADIEYVLAGAVERGLSFVTYADMARGVEHRPGLALSFDDASIPQWYDLRPLFDQYGARVTFFISRYAGMYPEWHEWIHDLERDGHEIAAHSVAHLRAPTYVEEHGLDAYIKEEALPSIQALRDAGHVVTSFAYPYGARTGELDDAILKHVDVLRSVSFSLQGAPDPCPH
jgi:peptidoglycan/xylan/chitin deacetylase (PgdA/CDA1 family)